METNTSVSSGMTSELAKALLEEIMGRLFLFIIVAIVAGIIAASKSAVGKLSGNEELKNASLKGEAKKVMDKTAKGISWMEKQWEESKKDAEPASKKITSDD